MSSLAPDARRAAHEAPPPRVAPAPAPAGQAIARWHYVDAARTHEVHAGIRSGPRAAFVVKESAHHNTDPDEIATTLVPLGEPWEAAVALGELEKRLALVGEYWRHDAQAPGWTRLPPRRFDGLDLRPTRAGLYEGRVGFHHFAKPGAQDVVLVALPVESALGRRYLLARATIEFPDAEAAQLVLVHARLPHQPGVSILAREHLDLFARGHRKLVEPAEIEARHGPRWRAEAHAAYDALLRRISDGRFGAPTSGDAARPIDDAYTDYMRNLADPRLLALHARFLTPDEERDALAGGEVAIKHLVAKKRVGANAHDNMLLSLLEASLLARDGLRAGQASVDPEVAALVRRFAYYL